MSVGTRTGTAATPSRTLNRTSHEAPTRDCLTRIDRARQGPISYRVTDATTVLGTMIAQNFLAHGLAHGDLSHGHGADYGHDADHAHDSGADTGDIAGGLDDIGADFDGGSFDV